MKTPIDKKDFICLSGLVMLVLFYFRKAIFAPLNTIPSRHVSTDLWGDIYFAYEKSNLIQDGFIPWFGWWVPRGGGYPSTQIDTMFSPSQLALMGLNGILDNWFLTLKILIILSWILLALASYWYGRKIFKTWETGLIFAVGFTFTAFMGSQLEHMTIIFSMWMIPVALLSWEHMMRRGGYRWVALSSFSLIYLFLDTNWYLLLFTGAFIIFRMIYLQATRQLSCGRLIPVALFFTFIPILPLFLSDGATILFHVRSPAEAAIYTSPPEYLLLRGVLAWGEFHYLYIGIALSFFAWISVVTPDKKWKREVWFMIAVALVAFWYGSAHFLPVNLYELSRSFLPFTGFVRVPTRAFLLVYFVFAYLACVGYLALKQHGREMFSRKMAWLVVLCYIVVAAWFGIWIVTGAGIMGVTIYHLFKESKRIRRFTYPKTVLGYVMVILIVSAVYFDLTWGFEPPPTEPPIRDNDAYRWLQAQEGTFRILEIPSGHDWQVLTTMQTGHETLNYVLWLFQFWTPGIKYAKLYFFGIPDFFRKVFPSDDALNIDVSEYAARTGVKYAVFHVDREFYDAHNRDVLGYRYFTDGWRAQFKLVNSGDWREVYRDGEYVVLENLRFKGYAYTLNSGETVQVWRPNPNIIRLHVETDKDTVVFLSENYFPTWRCDGYEVFPDEEGYMNVRVPVGVHDIELRYENPITLMLGRRLGGEQ